MFIPNKYTTWYTNIVSKATERNRQQGQYYERHHILPKCMGGTNHKSNLVYLTGKEHFICHLLLTKMTDGHAKYRLVYAFNCMATMRVTDGRHQSTNSQTYAYLKTCLSIARKKIWDDPILRQQAKERQEKRWTDPTYREKMTLMSQRMWDDEQRRQEMSTRSKMYFSIPENRKRASLRSIEISKDPIIREKKTHRGSENGMWGKTHTDEIKQKLGQLAKERFTGKSYEERHGAELATSLRKKRSDDMSRHRKKRPGNGATNPNYKNETFTFIHSSGDQFTGTRQEFHELRGLRRGDISQLIHGKQKTARGWRLLQPLS